MQSTLFILSCVIGTVLSKYHEKTRFDRSVHLKIEEPPVLKKQWYFTDSETHFTAYKDKSENNCYLENLLESHTQRQNEWQTKVLYAGTQSLTKIEAWRIAGGRIVEFCQGRHILLLQNTKPNLEEATDPFYNQIPIDENDIVTKRVTDVVLTPLRTRAKRQILLEEREEINRKDHLIRSRRQASQFRGQFRGQTQSQYLNIGETDQKDGKAEAEATQESSRAIVSGSRGMGQAQSMSLGGTGCEDCPGYPGYGEGGSAPDKLRAPGSLSSIGQYSQVPKIETSGVPSGTQPGSGVFRPGVGLTGGDSTKLRRPSEGYDRFGNTPQIGVQNRPMYPGNVPSAPSGTIRTDGVPSSPQLIGDLGRPDRLHPGTARHPGLTSTPGLVQEGQRIYTGNVPSGVHTYPREMIPGQRPGGTYPSQIHPGGYPGGVLTQPSGVAQPGAIPQGTVITDGSYPDGTVPGNRIHYPTGTVPDVSATYPQRIGSTTDVVYPGGFTPQAGLSYPNINMPGGQIMYPNGIVGTGGYPGQVGQGVATPTTGLTTQLNRQTPGIDKTPGAITTGGSRTIDGTIYSDKHVPGSAIPGSNVGYPGITQERIPYAPAQMPGTVSGFQPESGTTIQQQPGVYPGTQTGIVHPGGRTVYPDATMNGRLPVSGDQTYFGHPAGTKTSTANQGVYPGNVPQGVGTTGDSNRYVPHMIPTESGAYPAGTSSGTGTSNILHPTHIQQQPAQNVYPSNIVPGGGMGSTGPAIGGNLESRPGGATMLPYPGGTISNTGQTVDSQGSRGLMYPGNIGTGIPGSSFSGTNPQTTYPGSINGQIPHQGQGQLYQNTNYPQQVAQYPDTSTGTRYQTGITGGGAFIDRQGFNQYPSITGQERYPGGIRGPGTTDEVSQYYRQSGQNGQTSDTIPVEEDNTADSQASSSVKQVDSGTQASASAQGKYGQGTAQSQVMGTYSGSGSFSAQAGTSDSNKSVQTEVSGSKDGAMSNAQGIGGYGKSQTQVQLESESGATSTGAQTSGWNHGTNSQVQASSKGGMADAQANGQGSTSSQAQIGFQPYLKTNDKLEKHARPFHGGGSASAQSGTYRGQSQSQLEGSFKYGISYTGAAQAGSGSGAAASRKPFNFNITDSEIFKPFKPYDPPTITKDTKLDTANSQPIDNTQEESSNSRKVIVANETKENTTPTDYQNPHLPEKSHNDDTAYEATGDYSDDYDDEDYDTQGNSKEQHQLQVTHVNNGNRYNIGVKQKSNLPQVGDMLESGDSLPGYTIPAGFRARVTSVSGEQTVAQGDGKSQAQTIHLTPKENKSAMTKTRALQTVHEKVSNHHTSNTHHSRSTGGPIKPSYYTVTNSVVGKMDDNGSTSRKYEHRYYTKSSTCGYFTLSCNIVYGSNGRTKICKPKVPTYPDGTPMKC